MSRTSGPAWRLPAPIVADPRRTGESGGVSGLDGGLWAVVPVFDEAPTIAAVVLRLAPLCPVIVVDDASGDESGPRAAAAGAAGVVRHPRRLGKGAALRTGFAAALARGASRVATLDGDAQHDPADLGHLLAAARAAPEALVVGDRLGPGRGDPIPSLRFAAIRAADWLVARLTGTSIRDSQCGFRIYPATLLRQVRLREEGFVLETEVLVRAVRAGHPLVSVPIRRLYPAARQGRFRALADGRRIGRYLAGEAVRGMARALTHPVRARQGWRGRPPRAWPAASEIRPP